MGSNALCQNEPQAVSESGVVQMGQRKGLAQLMFKYRKMVVCLVAAAPVLLRFLGGGWRIELSHCPSQVTLLVGCQAGWTAVAAACLASVVHDKVDMGAQAVL